MKLQKHSHPAEEQAAAGQAEAAAPAPEEKPAEPAAEQAETAPGSPDLSAEEKGLIRKWRWAAVRHWLGLLLRLIIALLCALVLLLQGAFLGPSRTVCNMLTLSMLESSALKFVPGLFLRDEVVEEIVLSNAVVEPEAEVDSSMILIPDAAETEADSPREIELIPLSGPTYRGYLMIVPDPSQVFLGVVSKSFTGVGMRLDQLVAKYDALGGVNASAFQDPNGMGNGGNPIGTVIAEGELLRFDYNYPIAAFDENDVLHVGRFTMAEIKELGLRDGAGWGPVLIVNGVPANITDTPSGLNPRTAIGQRADGAVLLVVLDGRHAGSLGGTYADLIAILMEHGAVNACNLDGGYSSCMIYEGERISDITTIENSRNVPTAFLIRKEGSK